jgi:hypothetical protein
MAQPIAARRAAAYRQRAELARHEWRDEGRRQHMLDLAATYQHVANALVPPWPRELLIEHLRERG